MWQGTWRSDPPPLPGSSETNAQIRARSVRNATTPPLHAPARLKSEESWTTSVKQPAEPLAQDGSAHHEA